MDGSQHSLGPIVSEMVTLGATIGDHPESLCFDFIGFPDFSVILGTPWLYLYNPDISWGLSDLCFNPPYCLQSCLEEIPLAGTQARSRAENIRLLTPTIKDLQPALMGSTYPTDIDPSLPARY